MNIILNLVKLFNRIKKLLIGDIIMKATFEVQVQESKFPAGTVGGDWHWVLRPEDEDTIIKDWSTSDLFAESDVESEKSYKISVQRMDPNKNPLGPVTSAGFTTESVPQDVLINVSSAILIAVDGVPVGSK